MTSVKLNDSPDVLTVVEAAKLIRLGRNNCYQLIREGKIRVVRVGRRLLVPKSSLLEFLAGA